MIKAHYMAKHTTERPFECPECDFKAKTAYLLKNHRRTHGEPTYRCQFVFADGTQCPVTTKQPAGLRNHQLVHAKPPS